MVFSLQAIVGVNEDPDASKLQFDGKFIELSYDDIMIVSNLSPTARSAYFKERKDVVNRKLNEELNGTSTRDKTTQRAGDQSERAGKVGGEGKRLNEADPVVGKPEPVKVPRNIHWKDSTGREWEW